MDDHLRQLFEAQLMEATDRLAERAVHRCGGHAEALRQLEQDPDAEGVWASEFVAAYFSEQLLDNAAGACFVLQALQRRTLPADPGGPATEVLQRLAHAAFRDVLVRQVSQALQRAMVFEG